MTAGGAQCRGVLGPHPRQIDSDSHREQGWTWSYLTGRGRRYLAQFLVPISEAVIEAQAEEDSDSE